MILLLVLVGAAMAQQPSCHDLKLQYRGNQCCGGTGHVSVSVCGDGTLWNNRGQCIAQLPDDTSGGEEQTPTQNVVSLNYATVTVGDSYSAGAVRTASTISGACTTGCAIKVGGQPETVEDTVVSDADANDMVFHASAQRAATKQLQWANADVKEYAWSSGASHANSGRRLVHNRLKGIVNPGGHSPVDFDDRDERCSNKHPYNKVVRIIYKNSGAVCTGTLVGPKHVLTAGHCLYNFDGVGASTNGWLDIKGVQLLPCVNQQMQEVTDASTSCSNSAPCASPRPADWSDAPIDFGWDIARTVKGWTQSGKWSYDYGLLTLSSETGQGWMSFGYDNSLPSYSFNLNGYPGATAPQGTGDRDGGLTAGGSPVYWTGFELAHDFDKTHKMKSKTIEYYIDTWGGQSGSAVYAYFTQSGRRTIYGVHRGWDGSNGELSDNPQTQAEYNVAKRITSHTFYQLRGWIDDARV